jgi:hypothetical protein
MPSCSLVTRNRPLHGRPACRPGKPVTGAPARGLDESPDERRSAISGANRTADLGCPRGRLGWDSRASIPRASHVLPMWVALPSPEPPRPTSSPGKTAEGHCCGTLGRLGPAPSLVGETNAAPRLADDGWASTLSPVDNVKRWCSLLTLCTVVGHLSHLAERGFTNADWSRIASGSSRCAVDRQGTVVGTAGRHRHKRDHPRRGGGGGRRLGIESRRRGQKCAVVDIVLLGWSSVQRRAFGPPVNGHWVLPGDGQWI